MKITRTEKKGQRRSQKQIFVSHFNSHFWLRHWRLRTLRTMYKSRPTWRAVQFSGMADKSLSMRWYRWDDDDEDADLWRHEYPSSESARDDVIVDRSCSSSSHLTIDSWTTAVLQLHPTAAGLFIASMRHISSHCSETRFSQDFGPGVPWTVRIQFVLHTSKSLATVRSSLETCGDLSSLVARLQSPKFNK